MNENKKVRTKYLIYKKIGREKNLDQLINKEIETLENKGHEIMNVTFSETIGAPNYYSVLIVYKK